MSSINTHVGKMIRKYRKAANLTLQQLADELDAKHTKLFNQRETARKTVSQMQSIKAVPRSANTKMVISQ